ncbi:MAG TPA: BadF/BadG/BcrA/BcrD ATPase family protein [Opitutaceae bacterium]|jgi:N-acetylglucosamine kinase-like BadF-type ATPase
MNYRLGVDGGGTKTEAILVDASGSVAARASGVGCNPSLVGPQEAKQIVADLLRKLLAPFPTSAPDFQIVATQLCMAGNRAFWQEFAASLTTFGRVDASDDSIPVLELATAGGDGLVLHAGTGSFVAARDRQGVHYAGGLGWRFGDAGSGFDISRRAIARALLELQGWMPPSGLAPFIQEQTGLAEAQAISRFYYNDSAANPKISSLAPGVLALAGTGDPAARELVVASTRELLALALHVARKLFDENRFESLAAGLSGPILTHPFVAAELSQHAPFRLKSLAEPPIEGVRRILCREQA